MYRKHEARLPEKNLIWELSQATLLNRIVAYVFAGDTNQAAAIEHRASGIAILQITASGYSPYGDMSRVGQRRRRYPPLRRVSRRITASRRLRAGRVRHRRPGRRPGLLRRPRRPAQPGRLAAVALNSGNYDLSYQGNNLTITKALLNVIADAKTKV